MGAGAIILFSAQILSFRLYKMRLQNYRWFGYNTYMSLRKEMALRGRLEPICSPDAPTPMIMGYFRPIPVLPWEDYTPEQMSFITERGRFTARTARPSERFRLTNTSRPPGDERNEAAIYAPIAELFDVAGSCKRLISNETYEIATVAVRRDGKENFGILCYNTELNVYVAFEFDGERVSEEEVEAMAGVVGG